MKNLTVTQLRDYLAQTDDDLLLLDVREPWEFERCHIEGSTLIPMGQIRSVVNELDPDQETIVICHHGIRSLSVASYLEQQMDFTNITNLVGGVERWAREVDLEMALY